MIVDITGLHSGAATSYGAARHAHEGAERLRRANLPAGVFGDFAAADGYHDAVSRAHDRHLHTMRYHQAGLGALGDKAHHAAAAFAEMEEQNASALRAFRCNWNT
jgi:hypothetical protein